MQPDGPRCVLGLQLFLLNIPYLVGALIDNVCCKLLNAFCLRLLIAQRVQSSLRDGQISRYMRIVAIILYACIFTLFGKHRTPQTPQWTLGMDGTIISFLIVPSRRTNASAYSASVYTENMQQWLSKTDTWQYELKLSIKK